MSQRLLASVIVLWAGIGAAYAQESAPPEAAAAVAQSGAKAPPAAQVSH